MASVFLSRCHDRIEQGVSIPRGPSEWDLAPDINKAVRDELWMDGHDPYRLEDGTLTSRVKVINAMCADKSVVGPPYYAIEIHFNSSRDTGRQGFFAMAHRNSREGIYLANRIVDEMAHVLGHNKNRGVNKVDSKTQWVGRRYAYKTARQYFVCKTVCPAVLIEVGFLSSPTEAAWLVQSRNRSRLGKAIGQGIVKYLKGNDHD